MGLPNRGNYKNKRLSTLQKKRKAVSRAYGGNLCHQAVRLRIIRAFLSEETRIASKYRKKQKVMKKKRRLERKNNPNKFKKKASKKAATDPKKKKRKRGPRKKKTGVKKA